MTLVVDASAAIKWVVNEEGRAGVRQRSAGQRLAAPDFVLIETANILWKKVRLGQLDQEQARSGHEFIRDAYEVLHPTPGLSDRAFAMALEFDHPVYDCLYVACARQERAELLTSDARLANVAGRAGVQVSLVTADTP